MTKLILKEMRLESPVTKEEADEVTIPITITILILLSVIMTIAFSTSLASTIQHALFLFPIHSLRWRWGCGRQVGQQMRFLNEYYCHCVRHLHHHPYHHHHHQNWRQNLHFTIRIVTILIISGGSEKGQRGHNQCLSRPVRMISSPIWVNYAYSYFVLKNAQNLSLYIVPCTVYNVRSI